jgi:hypothetical protein
MLFQSSDTFHQEFVRVRFPYLLLIRSINHKNVVDHLFISPKQTSRAILHALVLSTGATCLVSREMQDVMMNTSNTRIASRRIHV